MPLPAIKLSPRNKQILLGSLVLALGMAAGAVIDGGDAPTREKKLADLGAQVTAGSALTESDKLDVPAYHDAISKVREGRPDVTDLLTAPVDPGATVTTEVNLPFGSRLIGHADVPLSMNLGDVATVVGARVVDVVEYVGPADGKFATVSVGYVDVPAATDAGVGSTRLSITARNTSTIRLRMTALIQFAAGG